MELFPPLPLAEWQDTKQTLHRFCEIVGKLRLAAARNPGRTAGEDDVAPNLVAMATSLTGE